MRTWFIYIVWILMCSSMASASDSTNPRWMDDVTFLASDELEGRRTGTQGAQRSRDFIEQRFIALGLQTLPGMHTYTQPFRLINRRNKSVEGVNVVAANITDQAPLIVLTAHYDHLGRKGRRIFNGADDNASGVAAMLEIAARSTQQPMHCSWVFLATDAEEHGLLGAKAFIQSNVLNQQTVFSNLNLDMLSQPGSRHELLVSGINSHPQFSALRQQVEEKSGVRMTNTDEKLRVGMYPGKTDRTKVSDHAIFAQHNIPFLFLGVGRHGYYHTPRDTASRINAAFYSKMVEASWMFANALDTLCGQSDR